MSLFRYPQLGCDTRHCEQRFIGRASEPSSSVRKRAASEGWEEVTFREPWGIERRDYCPTHHRANQAKS